MRDPDDLAGQRALCRRLRCGDDSGWRHCEAAEEERPHDEPQEEGRGVFLDLSVESEQEREKRSSTSRRTTKAR